MAFYRANLSLVQSMGVPVRYADVGMRGRTFIFFFQGVR